MNKQQCLLESIYFEESFMDKLKSIKQIKIDLLGKSIKKIKTTDQFKKLTKWVPRSQNIEELNNVAKKTTEGFSKRKSVASKALTSNKLLAKIIDPLSTSIALASKDEKEASQIASKFYSIKTANKNVLMNLMISAIFLTIFSVAYGQFLVKYAVVLLIIDAVLYIIDALRDD